MKVYTDFLVVGTGIAGTMASLKLSQYGDVLFITKRSIYDSSSYRAQGGVAAVVSHEDSFELHINDTLRTGAGLCKKEVVESVVKEGPQRVMELMELGVRFEVKETSSGEKEFDLGMEGGHSKRRVLHAGDITGREIQNVLFDKIQNKKNIQVLENHICIDLITHHKFIEKKGRNKCYGAYVLNSKSGEVLTVLAKATFLATGGSGKVYLVTTNPDTSTGDGVAIAYRAGVPVANMEFIQFHPTCLYHPIERSFLISEALRGEGGILKTKDGTPFMHKYHPMKELAPRDVVARAIDSELKKSGERFVYLDMTHLDSNFLKRRFPNIYETLLRLGIDMTKDPIPVTPASHYMCGGICVDMNGSTEIERLYAIGETAHTGLHGANRLASNSLLEALVFAHRASMHARDNFKNWTIPSADLPDWSTGKATDPDEAVVITQNWTEIRWLMWNYVGIVRSIKRLKRAFNRIKLLQEEINQYYWDFVPTVELLELRNLALVAELIIRSAYMRKESRGLHYMIDYPEPRDDFLRDTVLRKGEEDLF